MTRPMRRAARALVAARDGSLGVEMALVAPIAILLIAFAVDSGRLLSDWTELRGAARAGADFAIRYPSDMEGVRRAVIGAADIDMTAASVATAVICECPASDNVSTAPIDCSGICPTGSLRSYVSVGVSQPFAPIFPHHASILPDRVGAQAVIRAQ